MASYFEQLKNSFLGDSDGGAANQSSGTPVQSDMEDAGPPGAIAESVTPPMSNSPPKQSETTWTTFVESMDHARKRASVMFTMPPTTAEPPENSQPEPEVPLSSPTTPAPQDTSVASSTAVVPSAMKSWFDDAAHFFEETKLSIDERITEMTGPAEIKNDPLRKLRDGLVTYNDALESLKTEAMNVSIFAENFARLGAASVGTGIEEGLGQNSMMNGLFKTYKEKHARLILPALDELRAGVETVGGMIVEEVNKIQAVQTRFKRRDRLHKTLLDQRARVELRRERNNKKVLEGLQVESRALDDLYEQSRAMEALESDFRITSEQVISKCNALLQNRSRTYHGIFTKLVETQNTFIYRLSNSCSIPFQEMFENIRFNVPPEDEMDDLGSHPLTWRSRQNSDEETTSPTKEEKVSPTFSRRATVNIAQRDSINLKIPQVPQAYTYQKGSTIRRAGTAAILEESPSGNSS